jgi:hypothetical protein
VINIPRVIEFSKLGGAYRISLDEWRNFGFYQFSAPAIEVSLMMFALRPFFLVT